MFLKRLLGIAALTLIGAAVPIIALEVVLRAGLLSPSPAPRPNDRPSRYFLHAYSGNERDYPHDQVKAPGVFRIVIVGDSFTFGDYLQFDDTFSKRLERWLNLNDGPRKVEVINYSKPGFSTFDEVPLVKTAAETLSPDLILLQFTLNDAELKPYRDTHRDENKGWLYDSFLARHWRGLQFALSRYKVWTSRGKFREYYFSLFERPETWNRCAEALARMAAITKERGIPFGAVIFPLFDYPMNERYPFTPLHEKVQARFTELKVPWVDLFDSYRGLTPERLAVIPGENSHPNEIANRIAAERIYRWLGEQSFLPKEQFAVRESKFRNIYNPFRIKTTKPIPGAQISTDATEPDEEGPQPKGGSDTSLAAQQ